MSYQKKKIEDNVGFENALEEVFAALGEAGCDGRPEDPAVTVIFRTNGKFTDDENCIPLIDATVYIGADEIDVATDLAQVS